jgi:hypothetical protein
LPGLALVTKKLMGWAGADDCMAHPPRLRIVADTPISAIFFPGRMMCSFLKDEFDVAAMPVHLRAIIRSGQYRLY